ncbi:CPBP family intramembrane glutamic endopeptidase [Modestobacter altitudinis]|uniref:CPBP family intramembrane glutamic endopeptidase n=1 Tax=Modestobacter altitudinis TaxID=2213158 RepID=UPI00110CEFCD|nr:type II CAAX endopeptidase family protein [Modestobacter altitudinis]
MTAAGWGAPPPEQPYSGPPPTGRYGAPPQVPVGVPGPSWGGPPWGGPPWGGPPWGGPPWGAPPWGAPPWGAPPWGGPPPPVPTPGPVRAVTPPGAPPFDTPQPYALLMRARDWAWWRPLLGLLLFSVLYAVAAFVVFIVFLVTGVVPDLALLDLTDVAVLLVTNLSLIVAIPIVWVCWLVPHGVGIGWSSSVLGRLRWRLFGPVTWRALATLGVAVALGLVIAVAATGVDVTGPGPSFGWMLLVVLTTTPLQAAAEEYVFRGYLSQTIAGWIGRPVVGAAVAGVVSAALFSAAHAPPDFQTFLYRFAIGLALSAAVWLTGGLEASIALHAVNNVVIFLLAGALGDRAAAAEPGGVIGWATSLLGILGMVAFVGWLARSRPQLRPELLSPAVDLRPGTGPVGGRPGGPSGWVPGPPPVWG